MKARIIPEMCCEFCNEVIHNHFDKCPECGSNYAPTGSYGDIEDDEEVACEHCKTRFRKVSTESWYDYDLEVEKAQE